MRSWLGPIANVRSADIPVSPFHSNRAQGITTGVSRDRRVVTRRRGRVGNMRRRVGGGWSIVWDRVFAGGGLFLGNSAFWPSTLDRGEKTVKARKKTAYLSLAMAAALAMRFRLVTLQTGERRDAIRQPTATDLYFLHPTCQTSRFAAGIFGAFPLRLLSSGWRGD